MNEISEDNWKSFEEIFENISKKDVIEINNIYKHVCRLFIDKKNLEILYKKRENREKYIDEQVFVYELKYNFNLGCYDKWTFHKY